MTRVRVQTFEDSADSAVTGDVFLRDTASSTGGAWTAVGAATSVYKTADESVTSSTTLQNDDHLTISVLAGRRYFFSGVLFMHVDGTSGSKLSIGGTATFTTMKIQASVWDSLGARDTFRITGTGDVVFHTSVGGADDHYYELQGAIEVNGAGTILVQWAQNSSNVNACTMQKASTIILTRMT